MLYKKQGDKILLSSPEKLNVPPSWSSGNSGTNWLTVKTSLQKNPVAGESKESE